VIRAAVAAMYARRGNLVQWIHTVVPAANTLDASTGNPKASLGGARLTNVGNFGETFLPPVEVIAYFSNKTTSFTQQGFGNVDVGDAQLDFAVPYVRQLGSAILLNANPDADPPVEATNPSLDDYNNGNFADIRGEQTIRLDRFVVNGLVYQAKAVAVPIVDMNVVVAWRLLVTKVAF
jgi:hypothetical protein